MNLLIPLLLAALGFLLTYTVTPFVGNYMKRIGKVGQDVHKADRPEIPESGGIGFMTVFLLLLLVGYLIAPSDLVKSKLLIMTGILVLVTLVGLYDDFVGLSALAKPAILVLVATPVFIFRTIGDLQVAVPKPVLPFIGATNLTIVYWFLAVFVVAIPSNASNMLDVMNGVMSLSGILIGVTAFLTSFIIPLEEDTAYFVRYTSLILVGVLFGFWLHNRYPAKIFAGDTGSLGVGATLGLLAVYGQIEFVLVVALLVHIMNSFSIISSVRGLRERKQMRERPVRVEKGVIHASRQPSAPVTLVRLIVARAPSTEDQVVKQIILLVGFSCVLALISALLIRLEIS